MICHIIHGFAFHPYQPAWIQRAYEAAERATARITTRFIVVSRHDELTALRAGIGRPEQYAHTPVRHRHRALSSQRPQPAPGPRTRLGLLPDAPTIGMVASLKPRKARRIFLEVCARMRQMTPQLQAVLVGDGVLRSQVERRIAQLGLEGIVRVLGWRRDIPEIPSGSTIATLR